MIYTRARISSSKLLPPLKSSAPIATSLMPNNKQADTDNPGCCCYRSRNVCQSEVGGLDNERNCPRCRCDLEEIKNELNSPENPFPPSHVWHYQNSRSQF
jgi:hypothetical protein